MSLTAVAVSLCDARLKKIIPPGAWHKPPWPAVVPQVLDEGGYAFSVAARHRMRTRIRISNNGTARVSDKSSSIQRSSLLQSRKSRRREFRNRKAAKGAVGSEQV